jgi:FAD/FMN-containing dehydrogenase
VVLPKQSPKHHWQQEAESQFILAGAADPLWDNLTARWSDLAGAQHPTCIVRPSSAEDVSRAVKILVAGDCAFAIKSGGHMSFPGANSLDGGIAVDLGLLQTMALSPDRRTASLGTGLTWQAVYGALDGTGVTVPGGTCGTTGVGGLSVGGGQSYTQAAVGWLVDNVEAYEVVLASGAVVVANASHHADLYRGLKGGSSNLGVVTRVDVATSPQADVWAGQIFLPAALPGVVEAFAQAVVGYTEANNQHVNAGIQAGAAFLADGRKVLDVAVVATDGTVNPPVLRNLTALQPQLLNTVRTRSLVNLVDETDMVFPHGYRSVPSCSLPPSPFVYPFAYFFSQPCSRRTSADRRHP